MPWTDIVNERQREAIESDAPNCAVVAGPGTGKTRSLLGKALQLVEEEIAPAGRLRIVNFTNAGVRDLKRKVAARKEYSPLDPRTIMTFHSLALSALRRVNAPSVPSPLVILDDWEERMLLDQFAKSRLGLPDIRKARRMREDYNSRWCMARLDIDDWLSEMSRRNYEAVYNVAKDLLGFTTRGELTFLWWRHMRSVPGASAEEFGIDADYVLADEYQDLNECEHEILQLLAKAGVQVFAVGDPNQSIYEQLRHAHPHLCWEFPNRLSPADLKLLDKSYRCPRAVLVYGAALLGSASGVPDANKAPTEGQAHILAFPSHDGEQSGVARLARRYLDEEPRARVMLALPARALARPFATALEEVGVEFEDRTRREEGGSTECRLAKALLRLLMEANDSVAAATAVILSCAPTTRSRAANELLSLAYNRGERVAAILGSGVSIQGSLGKAIEKVRTALHDLQREGDIAAKVQEMTGCVQEAPTLNELQDRLEDLLDDPTALDGGKVTIMTLHSAKGLEADWVILPAVEPGFFERDLVGARKEERRRLLYVGMTRAVKGAFLTFARTRYGPTRYADPIGPSPRKGSSVFLDEICDRLAISPEDGGQFLRALLR